MGILKRKLPNEKNIRVLGRPMQSLDWGRFLGNNIELVVVRFLDLDVSPSIVWGFFRTWSASIPVDWKSIAPAVSIIRYVHAQLPWRRIIQRWTESSKFNIIRSMIRSQSGWRTTTDCNSISLRTQFLVT